VRRITMRTGTKKIRNSVNELGRFMSPWRRREPPVASATAVSL
jgi:hypothetical protein